MQINMAIPGPLPAFTVFGAEITIKTLTIDTASLQQDAFVSAVVYGLPDGTAALETTDSRRAILAQIDIPARTYDQREITTTAGIPGIERTPLPLDPATVIVKLWGDIY